MAHKPGGCHTPWAVFLPYRFNGSPCFFIYNLMIFADSLVESLFPALVFGIYWKRSTRKAAIVSVSVGAVIICLTFFVWGLGYVWYGTIGLVVSLVLMWVVSLVTKDDPKDSEDFYEALDSGHRRFMRINAKIKV